MKSLIIGSNGLVGTALSKELPNAIKTVHSSKPVSTKFQLYADLLKYETLFEIFKNYRPDVVYLPASITNVDACENVETNAVNIRGAVTVLRLCESFECKFVYFSSGYVFDGEQEWPYAPDQETNPINNYGKQKETVERMILSSNANYLIIRTMGVFGREKTKKNFVSQIIKGIVSEKTIFVPSDQWMNPIESSDLARITIQLSRKHTGIWHVAGDTCKTKYEIAKEIAEKFDSSHLIVGLKSEELKQVAPRPKMGCLDCYDLENVGISIPSYSEGLKRFLSLELHE